MWKISILLHLAQFATVQNTKLDVFTQVLCKNKTSFTLKFVCDLYKQDLENNNALTEEQSSIYSEYFVNDILSNHSIEYFDIGLHDVLTHILERFKFTSLKIIVPTIKSECLKLFFSTSIFTFLLLKMRSHLTLCEISSL